MGEVFPKIGEFSSSRDLIPKSLYLALGMIDGILPVRRCPIISDRSFVILKM
jgi:hypothetical protein